MTAQPKLSSFRFRLLCIILVFSQVWCFKSIPLSKISSVIDRAPPKSRLSVLVPLKGATAESLLATGPPNGDQYGTYWGRTPAERYGRLLESVIVSFLGVFFSYFLSFVLGGFVATILGALFCFWAVLSPELQAYQRNWEFLGGRKLVSTSTPPGNGLYSALFLGRILDACVVEDAAESIEYELADFSDYSMEEDELEKLTGRPYLLRIRCLDKSGRELQLHARLSEEYVASIQPGLPVALVMLSKEPSFERLAALTDLYVPEANLWVGDYPYLNREEVEGIFANDDELWNALQEEGALTARSMEVGEPGTGLSNDDYVRVRTRGRRYE